MPELVTREKVTKVNLITTTDQYASQTAQNPETSRQIKGLIPSQAGYIDRENAWPLFAQGTNLPSKVLWLYEFDQNNNGTILRFFFAATATTLYQLVSGTNWQAVSVVGTLANTPVAVTANNLLHFSDGVTAWLFDGSFWVIDGLAIPLHPPVFSTITAPTLPAVSTITRVNGTVTVVFSGTWNTYVGLFFFVTISGASDATLNGTFPVFSPNFVSGVGITSFTYKQPGFPDSSGATGASASFPTATIVSNRYYWTTFSDNTATRAHESSSSPRSILGTGALSGKGILVSPRPGSLAITAMGSTMSVVGSGTDFSQSDVGMTLFVSGVADGVITGVVDSQHMTVTSGTITGGVTAGFWVIAPARMTNINFYCSASENDQVGFFLGTVPLLPNTGQPWYQILDQSPFAGLPGSYINTTLQRPIRNDPPHGSKLMEFHKRRIFRRDENLQSNFNFTAFEEVKAYGTGDPYQSVPGNDPNSVSDIENDDPFPDQSVQLRAFASYADVLFLGSEKDDVPLFGESIDDFVLSQITAFSIGDGSRYCKKGTAQGLVFFSADKKLMLWPSQWIPFYAPEETTQLVELSRPLRPNFANILSSDMDHVNGVWFYYGVRNWFVVCFQDKTNVYHTWVFDFEIKGWFELHTGLSFIAVFEPSLGNKVLVGGGVDGNIYVIDDQNGIYTTNAAFPQGNYRTALIDFGAPDSTHVLQYLEYEVSNPAMQITVNYYLDPIDVDNPGTPTPLVMGPTKIGAGRFRGWFNANSQNGGTLCDRVLIELIVQSDTNAGRIRSLYLAANPASRLSAGLQSSGE